MKLQDIYDYFAHPPVTFLALEQAVCYVLSVLLEGELYPSELLRRLEREYPTYRMSDIILFNALNFLEGVGALTSYREKAEGRGRPRRMYQLTDEWQGEAEKLAQLWHTSAAKQRSEQSKLALA